MTEEEFPEIEKGIPIPNTFAELKRLNAEKESAVLKTMAIGDSVFFAWSEEIGSVNRLRNRLGARIRYAAPAKYSVRNWPTEDATGFRVWRIK